MDNITSDDIIPFLPIKLSEFLNNPMEELRLGPKIKSLRAILNLFIMQYKYRNVEVIYSNISYR